MIHSLWIIKNGLNLLYVDCECNKLNEDLLSGFFSAICAFAKTAVERELNSLIIGEFKFVFENVGNIYFIIKSDKDDNDYLLHKKIIRIKMHFFKKFHQDLDSWNGNISFFEKFQEKAEKILSHSIVGVKMYCNYCEQIITGKFSQKKYHHHNFFFCNETCKEQFNELYTEFSTQDRCED